MRNRQSILAFLRLAMGVMLGMAALSIARPADAQTIALQNPGFEGDYAPFLGDASRLVAPGWSPWNLSRQSGEPSWSNIVPQYVASTQTGRVKGGQRAQEFYELYATFTGGVFQQVQVAPGTPLRFSAFISVWSTELDDPNRSEKPSRVTVQVGIDPTGGTNGASNVIVWGSSKEAFDRFEELSVEAAANGNLVTVFVRAISLDPVRHNHIYVDDAALTLTSGPVPTVIVAQPSATATATLPLPPPQATDTPNPFVPTREGTIGPPTREGTLPPGFKSPTPFPVFPSPTPDTGGGPGFPDLPGRVNYVVRQGDSVSEIAVRFNSRVDAIIALNNLPGNGLIRIGQQLTIPVPAPPSTPTHTPAPVTLVPTVPGGGQGSAPVEVAVLDGPTVNGIGTYIMQRGDTLEAVARRYRVTLAELARLNGIVNPRAVVIGQVLAVPGPGNNRPGGTVAPTIIPTQPGGGQIIPGVGRVHVVQRGENLFRISLRYGVTMDAIARLNGIFNIHLIYVGQTLRIP